MCEDVPYGKSSRPRPMPGPQRARPAGPEQHYPRSCTKTSIPRHVCCGNRSLVDFIERKRRFFHCRLSGGRARPHSPHDRPHSLHDRPLAPLIGPIVPLEFKGRRTLRKFRSWSAPYSRRWGREGEGGGREEAGGREGTGGAHFSIDFPLIMENQWKAYINKSRQTKRKYFFP